METEHATTDVSNADMASMTSTTPLPRVVSPQPKPGLSKPMFTAQTQLTGAAAMAARAQQQQQKVRQNQPDIQKDTGMSTNPASVLSLQMSRPSDAPGVQSSSSHKALAGLPSIATAATAMDTSEDTPTTISATNSASPTPTTNTNSTTDPALLNQPTPSTPYTPSLSALHTNNLHFASNAPTTPAFTPTTPFSPSTPSGKKNHACMHCSQTFTRHHNLKSHLLTHSQEKPFICPKCNARFRRLHDLKRHSKLHTGERPYECNKCGRRFARGDALARHARAEGGCAGRRTSMAGFEDGIGMVGDGSDGMEVLGLIGAANSAGQDADGDIDMEGAAGGEHGDQSRIATSSASTSGVKKQGQRRQSLPTIKTNFAQQQQQHPSQQHQHQHLHHQLQQHRQPHLHHPIPNQTPLSAYPPSTTSTPAPSSTAAFTPRSPNTNLFTQPQSQSSRPSQFLLLPQHPPSAPTANMGPNVAASTPTPTPSEHQNSGEHIAQIQMEVQGAGQGAGVVQGADGLQTTGGTQGLQPGQNVWEYVRLLQEKVKSLEEEVKGLKERVPTAVGVGIGARVGGGEGGGGGHGDVVMAENPAPTTDQTTTTAMGQGEGHREAMETVTSAS